ncbi:MAG: glycosyltransferase family 2 protein [Proteobacteria bacterium]|nr:glycosyltransferase family 2 protein [Pseudomonadota bacterium]
MSLVITSALGLVAATLLVLAMLLFAEAILSLLPERKGTASIPIVQRPPIAVLVPAHNESASLLPTLADLQDQLRPADRLVVVADNCSDDTAAVARGAGAEVIERSDTSRRGKGYALAFGVAHLNAGDPPPVVIVVDADCRLGVGAIDRLTGACLASGRPTQALYLMNSAEHASIGRRIAAFAWRIKNWGRPLGLLRAGLPCHLMGTGMAFPWKWVAGTDFGGSNLVEDMTFGLELARQGAYPVFCPEAFVSSEFATSETGASTQRKRWEKGHIHTIVGLFPKLAADAIKARDVRLFALALDLAVPPLTLFCLLIGTSALAGAVAALSGLGSWPLYFSAWALGFLTLAVLVYWVRLGRDLLPPRDLARLPLYVLQKLTFYKTLATEASDVTWVRTDRS